MKSKAQNITEFVVLFSVLSLAAMSMSLYFRRGIQALVKVAADEAGSQQDAFDTDYRAGSAIWKLQSVEAQSRSSGSENFTKQSGGGVKHELQKISNTTYQDDLLSGELWYKQD